jgi:hypothetical protein
VGRRALGQAQGRRGLRRDRRRQDLPGHLAAERRDGHRGPARLVPEAGAARGRPHAEPDQFRRQGRDLYIPAGGIGFWQGAVRDEDDVFHAGLVAVIKERRRFAVELLYSDHEGGQHTISLFSVIPRDDRDDPSQWMCSVGRHWNIDRPDPR